MEAELPLLLIFLSVWVLSLWLGSVALESTGIERHKARFQALSALTGSGFTTSESESVVNHPARRSVITWLIVVGNVGFILLIFAALLLLKAAFTSVPIIQIGVIVGIILFVILFVWLGGMDKLTTRMVRLFNRKSYFKPDVPAVQVLQHVGDHVIARIIAGEKASASDSTLKSAGFWGRGLTLLAIERGNSVIQLPDADSPVQPDDHLLCYGETAEINRIEQ